MLEAAGIEDEQLGAFLRERGLHSEHLTLWDQEFREMVYGGSPVFVFLGSHLTS